MRLTEWLILNVPSELDEVNKDRVQLINGGNDNEDCIFAIGSTNQYRRNLCNEYFIGEFSYINIDNLLDEFEKSYS